MRMAPGEGWGFERVFVETDRDVRGKFPSFRGVLWLIYLVG